MKLLALEASAHTVSIAVQHGDTHYTYEMPANSKTSAWLIPSLLRLLNEAQIKILDLDAILFGQGPGAFTGLRTVCSVVQGLAMGSNNNLQIYGVDTLQELAQAALKESNQDGGPLSSKEYPPKKISFRALCILDARMDEWYVGAYEFVNAQWIITQSPLLCKPEQLELPIGWSVSSFCLCSNVELSILTQRLSSDFNKLHFEFVHAAPHASLCLDLAPWLMSNKASTTDLSNPLRATPIYVRDRIALTTSEREAAKHTHK